MNIENLLPEPVVRAYEEGRIAESSVAAWVERCRVEPEAAAARLATLAPGLRPTERIAGPDGAAPALTAAEAVEQLTGRRAAPAPPPPHAAHVDASPPPMSSDPGSFSDADFAEATRQLFPNGVGADAL